MDIEQYINSGILESYVLGAVSKQEQQEVSCLSSIYPEINEALLEAQQSMEKYISSIAIQPPAAIKARILNAIRSTEQIEASDSSNAKVIKLNEGRKGNLAKYGLVASIMMIAGLFYVLNMTSHKLDQSSQELSRRTEKVNNLQESILIQSSDYRDSIRKLVDKNQLLLSESTKLVALAGTDISPTSKVRVFWNKSQSEIVVIQDFLPTPNEMQYQLWAISNGKPISLGVLDKNGQTVENRRVEISEIEAFAVTLEVEGGAKSPDLSQLYVIGNT